MVAEAALLTPLGWLASPLIKMLFDTARRHLGTGIDKKMKILEATILPRLSVAIEKAEKSPNKGKLVDWLKRLKGAYYEAEEAIDLFEYELLKKKVKDDRKTLEQKARNERGTRISFPSQFLPRPIKIASVKLKYGLSVFSRQKIMLKGCIDKLIEIAKEANEFRDLLEVQEYDSGTSDADRETSSNPPVIVFGREEEKNKIVCLLRKKGSKFEPGPSTRPAISIIAITGHSGAGKTALAQHVYKYMFEQQKFDLLVWVHAPRKFKATDVIKSMIKNIEAKDHAPNNNPSISLEALSTQVRRMLGSKKLLLVLDDFWSDTEDFVAQWENFIGCLSSCLPESKILLTTQSTNVAGQVSLAGVTNVEPYYLPKIKDDEFLKLFMHYAWPSNSNLQKDEFEKIGRKIVVKLKGDPGAAKLVGHQLSEKLDLKHWEEVARKDWSGDNMKARIWSYQQLPLDLQRCFAFCSLFPKGLGLPKQFLINMWMAEGFIKSKDEQERLEDISENYLHELVSRFFLEPVAMDRTGIHYQLHDLLLDLAERVQGDDFIKIASTNSREVSSQISHMLSRSENIRHILLPSRKITELKEKLCLMKNIRTFCVQPDGAFVPKKVLEEILKHLKKLRVLFLPRCVDDFPDCIGNLKHLRFLEIYGSPPLKELPDSMCKLYHLQMLVLPKCESLPKNFSELISLRCIKTDRDTMSHISDVGRLTSLQGLDLFVVRKKCGNELHQLENLNQLRGKLSITGLQNVASTEDAIRANMKNKKHLETLEFEWNRYSYLRNTDNFTGLSTQHVQLLDALRPHPLISDLKIKGFGGDGLPNWLLSQNSLKHLRSLTLMNCDNVKEIPSIDESIPNCNSLLLYQLENLKKIPSLPPNLTYLCIAHLPQLSYFSEDDLLKKEERKKSILEAVKQIAECCPKIDIKFELIFRPFFLFVKERLEAASEICSTSDFMEIVKFDPLSGGYSRDQLLNAWVLCMNNHIGTMFNKNEQSKLILPSSLIFLDISSCTITSDALTTSIQFLVSLSVLKLSDIQTITSLPPKEILCSLKNLWSLTIDHCHLLSSLGGIGAVTSLKELELKLCLNLNPSNEPLPSSLEDLNFCGCSNIDVTCAIDVGNLSRLEKLSIKGWDGRLEGLNSLTTLHSLSVMHCPGINPSSPMYKYTFELHDTTVDNLFLLKLMLSDESISSIKQLAMFNFQGSSSDDEVFQSLTSLMQLSFYNCNATHLPKNLKNLASLSYMVLNNCPNLCELELEDLPRNLRQLQFKDCQTLTEKFNNAGPYRARFYEGSTIVTFLTEEEGNRF